MLFETLEGPTYPKQRSGTEGSAAKYVCALPINPQLATLVTLITLVTERHEGGSCLVAITLQKGRCISKGIHSNLHSALLQCCVQPLGQVKDGLQLE